MSAKRRKKPGNGKPRVKIKAKEKDINFLMAKCSNALTAQGEQGKALKFVGRVIKEGRTFDRALEIAREYCIIEN